MDALFVEDGSTVGNIETGVKNKWRWAWLDEKGDDGLPYRSWCKKIKQPGACMCVICHKNIQYGSNGKKVLARHHSDATHKAAVRSLEHTSCLPGASATTTNARASMADRVCDLKVRVCAFIAEHDLSLTMSQPLVELIQMCSNDKNALSRLSISNSHASYLCTHGLAANYKSELTSKLQGAHFSLNIDEATNENVDRILNVLIRFFDEERGKVVTLHLASRKANNADSKTLANIVSEVVDTYSLKWDQAISVLLDNCNVMRGKKSGVETLIRKENPALLDISGDTVHMASNAAKVLFAPFEGYVEDFCRRVYCDIEKFPKQKELFSELQSLLHLEPKSLMRPISTRFLQMLDVCNRLQELLDPLIVHYYSILSPADKNKYRGLLNQVLQKHRVAPGERARISVLQQEIHKSASVGSNENKRRKTSICLLFWEHEKLTTLVDLYRGVLPTFQSFIKRLQHEKPLMHVLHAEMVVLVREVLSKFIKPAFISVTVKDLLRVEVSNRALQYPDKNLCVGRFCQHALSKARINKKTWVPQIYESLRAGYIKAAAFLLKNLPLNNKIILALSALTPSLISQDSLLDAFITLAQALPNVLEQTEVGQLVEDVRAYQIDPDLVEKAQHFEEETARIDVDWWSPILSKEMPAGEVRFPTMGKLVKALLSLFSGPLVEGSFNIMGDIVEKDRASLNIETYEALAIIKSHIKASGKTSSHIDISATMRRMCLSSFSRYKTHLEQRKEKANKEKERKLRQAMKVLSAIRVKKVTKASKMSPARVATSNASAAVRVTTSSSSAPAKASPSNSTASAKAFSCSFRVTTSSSTVQPKRSFLNYTAPARCATYSSPDAARAHSISTALQNSATARASTSSSTAPARVTTSSSSSTNPPRDFNPTARDNDSSQLACVSGKQQKRGSRVAMLEAFGFSTKKKKK